VLKAVARSAVDEFLKVYSVRDADKIAAFLDDDVEWTISGPVDFLHFCGMHRGKKDVVDLIKNQIPKVLRTFAFVPSSILVDGDRLAMISRQSARRTSDGRVVSYRVANFMRFRDGKIVENVSLLDTYDAVEQLVGETINVNGCAFAAQGNVVAL
jgi:ketosteroid isomerase-like protein